MAPHVEKLTGFQLDLSNGNAIAQENTENTGTKYNLFTKSTYPKAGFGEWKPLHNQNSPQTIQLFGNKKPETTKIGNTSITLPELKNPFNSITKYFGNVTKQVNEYDAAVNHALKYLPTKDELDLIVKSNPRISAILAEANLPTKMNYDNLKTIKHSHIATTVQYARTIGKELGLSDAELQTMEVGAALHDIGKTLIPEEILNKKGKLTDSERTIVNNHSVLGYEILKSAGFGQNVSEIARDHHNPLSKNPYAQIVRAADVYSAMREERSYKAGKTHEEAMSVLRNMRIDNKILNALEKNYGTKQAPSSNPSYATQLAMC